jgi:hypothetical protein
MRGVMPPLPQYASMALFPSLDPNILLSTVFWNTSIQSLSLRRKSTHRKGEHHAMKAYWGSGGITPRILDLGTRWRSVVSFTHRPLYPQGKNAWYPLDRRLGGPQSRSGRCGEEKIPQPLPGLKHQIIKPVAQRYTAELTWLLFIYLFIYIQMSGSGSEFS